MNRYEPLFAFWIVILGIISFLLSGRIDKLEAKVKKLQESADADTSDKHSDDPFRP